MHDNLIILAGGASSRMKKEASGNIGDDLIKQANTRPKSLIAVDTAGRPVMDYLLYNAKRAGYKKIYIVIGEKETLIKEFYGSKINGNNFFGLNINYALQYIPANRSKPFGTADALAQTLEQYPELNRQTYTVCNSDNLYSEKVLSTLRKTTFANAFIAYDRDALKYDIERISRFSLVSMDKENFLENIIEKPSVSDSEIYSDIQGKLRVSMNIFKFEGKIFHQFVANCPVDEKRNEKELPTALLNMVKEFPKSVKGILTSEHVPDLTSKDDIIVLKKYIEANYIKMDWSK